MRIYIAGPYSAPEGTSKDEASKLIDANVADADDYARRLVKLGHTPFVPHTMMRGWEDRQGIHRDSLVRICNEWVAQCDALLFLGSSPGADIEKAVAESHGLPVFTRTNLPPERELAALKEEDIKDMYIAEYGQGSDSYRHTYQTIWSAGSVFFAVSGGMLALQGKSQSGQPMLTAAIWALALFPIWFWYLAIFRPMDRYGQKRRVRLAEIESILNAMFPPLAMKHFSDEDILGRKFNFVQFLIRPRVRWYVTVLGVGISIYELAFGLCKLLSVLGASFSFVNWVR